MKNIVITFISLVWSIGSLFAQKVVNVSHVAFTVSDTEGTVAFLKNTVEAKLIDSKSISGNNLQNLYGIKDDNLSLKVTRMHIGNEEVRLLEFESSKQGRVIPHTSKSNDLWFQHIAIVVNNMDKAYNKVADLKVEHVSTSPQTLPDYIPAAAGISAFYFRDKDDHNVELIYFPEGKGNPKWQGKSDTFLGIDHTAIGVSDTDEGLKFYKDVLGLKVAGNSRNYGTEQEHLNQVFGASLLITGLHAEKGFGVEFLQYIAPPDGQLYPSDSSPLDHWHWQTAMEVENLDELYKNIQNSNYKTVSSGIQSLPELGYSKAVIVRDYDGHAILLYEK